MGQDLLKKLRDHFAVIRLVSVFAIWALFHFLIGSSDVLASPFFRSADLVRLLTPFTLVYAILTVIYWILIIYDDRLIPRINILTLFTDLLYIYFLNLTFPQFHLIFLLAYIAVHHLHSINTKLLVRVAANVAIIALYLSATTGWPFMPDISGKIVLMSQIVASLWFFVITGYFGWKIVEHQQGIMKSLDRITVELLDTTLSTEIANQELKQQNKEITTLLQINEIISGSLEWEALFTNIILALKNSFIFKNFSLFLFDEKEKLLKLRISNGVFYDDETSVKLEPGQGIPGWVLSNRTSVCVGDASRDPRFIEFSSSKTLPASILCVPLLYRGAAIGAISLDSATTDNFTRKDQKFLESIAYLVSIAITNSMHFRIVKEESVTDNLTGLMNYRAFQNTIMEILEANQPVSSKLSFMMIDIDYFKKINDTYGHIAGNRILKSLAELFGNYFRKTDIVSRYGGEEFAIILQGSPLIRAQDMAESLRHRIGLEDFFVDQEEKEPIRLTISIGLGSFEDRNIIELAESAIEYEIDDLTRLKLQLIKNADEALYHAKREGRNMVVTWQQVDALQRDEPGMPGMYKSKG